MNIDFNFQAGKKSMYHTMKNVVSEKIDEHNTVIKSCTMTGLCKGIKEGSVVYLNPMNTFVVTKILEQRDHSRSFSNNEDRVNAYFKAEFKRV